jgi:hypothetical protein
MNAQKTSQPACAGILRRFRIAMLLFFVFAAFLFFGGLSWGAYSIPLLSLLGVGFALLPGILFIACGLVFGVVVGWMMALLKFCKRCVVPGR